MAQTAWRREEARLRMARRRSGETEGQAASSGGTYQECISYLLKTAIFLLKPTEVQSRTKFLNGVICGLSDRSGSEEAERIHRNKATMLSRPTGVKRQR